VPAEDAETRDLACERHREALALIEQLNHAATAAP
jgi:hypothetical protein